MKKTILIVDDFPNTLFVTGFTIQQAGYNVLKAASAKEGLQVLNSGETIDLIITDYNMPVMNGLEFVRAIKQLADYKSTPIFILSTEAKEEVRKEAAAAGVSLWIRKPFATDKLIEYIKRATD